MPNKINLITGETYNLGELFSGSRRIIIPDLQRDYCWGNKEDKTGSVSLAEGFIETLIAQFVAHPYGRLSLGLLYGYECPADYVQLCDGQQRITTLFLLLGMLNRWSGDDRFRQYLMSDFEFLDDDHEPYLQYSIRESSLYFMSDLVYRFFTNGGDDRPESVSDIYDPETGDSCGWFYGEYVTDPSIMSILSCLRSIEAMKERIIPGDDPDVIEKFVEFIVSRLTFIYYDMGTRANGEETFVIINTTGEPLSPTENLKPLVVNAEINKPLADELIAVGEALLPLPRAWEAMENYFWKIRRADKFDTADSGFNEFLRWVTLLHKYDSSDLAVFKEIAKEDTVNRFPYDKVSIKEIADLFNTFLRLRTKYPEFITDGDSSFGDGNKLIQRQLFVLLPLLAYLRKQSEDDPRQVKRLREFLRNLIRIDNVGRAVNDLLADVVRIGSTVTDPVEILEMEGISQTIMTAEERFKLEAQKRCPDDASRRSLEEDLWKAQDMEVDYEAQRMFDGEILPLLLWATPACRLDAERFSRVKFSHYLSLLVNLLSVKDNDPTRRGLLAFGYKDFPWGRSYGWGSNWKHIIAQDPHSFRRFMDEAEDRGLEAIIRRGAGNPIVDYPGLLAYSNWKNFDSWTNSGQCACLKSYARPVPVIIGVIMAKLGAAVTGGWQQCGRWWLNMLTNIGRLQITPADGNKTNVLKISVNAVDGGTKLLYHVEMRDYEFSIKLPLSSADTLIERLLGVKCAKRKDSARQRRFRRPRYNSRCGRGSRKIL